MLAGEEEIRRPSWQANAKYTTRPCPCLALPTVRFPPGGENAP